jgi:hypothetical protein
MNDKKWIIPYIVLFFLIFIPTALFLFATDHLKSVAHRITIVSLDPEYRNHLSPTQSIPNDPASCINDLYNKFQSGMLDLDSLKKGISKCFSLNPDNGDNNSLIIPQPQPPTANTPRFV